MAVVALEGMEFFAYHGLHEEERVIGTHFILDVWIQTEIKDVKVVRENDIDQVTGSINYALLYEVCHIQMQKPQKLLEHVIKNITNELKKQFDEMQMVRIRLRKKNPPVSGRVKWAVVENTESFSRECARCKRPMICYGADTNNFNAYCNCVALRAKIHPRTMEMLMIQHKGCLCPKCLKEFAG